MFLFPCIHLSTILCHEMNFYVSTVIVKITLLEYHLMPCSSKYGLWVTSTSSTWELVRKSEFVATTDLLNQNLNLSKIYRWFVCTLQFFKQWYHGIHFRELTCLSSELLEVSWAASISLRSYWSSVV